MRIDGLTHPKTKELAYTLDIPLPHAIGLLELMWAFVGQQTPQGNIGKWSNQVIAGEAGWQGNADEFINALISVGFLDENSRHRLLVHDWAEHCPNWVHAKLKKRDKKIIRNDLSPDLSETEEPPLEGATSLEKPSLAKRSETAGADTGGKPPSKSSGGKKEPTKPNPCETVFKHWQEVMGHARAKFDKKRKGKVKDRLADGYTAEDLMQAIDGCKKSPHHMGDNDHGTVYDGLELICRDAEHVDRFIAIAEGRGLKGKGQAEPNPPSRRALN